VEYLTTTVSTQITIRQNYQYFFADDTTV